jgi:hypothetical protein
LDKILARVQIVFDHSTEGLFSVHKRISRVRRTRTALRIIQRRYPNIRFTVRHEQPCVYVVFESSRDLFMFGLVWTLPQQWQQLVEVQKESNVAHSVDYGHDYTHADYAKAVAAKPTEDHYSSAAEP